MRPILICPAERPEVALLAAHEPLSNVPLLGYSMLEFWLSHLACSGAKEALVVTSDRPEQVQALIAGGARWGMKVEVAVESVELAPEQAIAKYDSASETSGSPTMAVVIDRFPGDADLPAFGSYGQCFSSMVRWIPQARTPERVGMREIQPGVWVGLHVHISPQAQLHAPCWIGDNAFVGAGAVIGPEAVVEANAFIEAEAQIEHSVVGPFTFVGKFVRVKDSLAIGDTLVDWKSNMLTKVSDAFLVCSLRPARAKRAGVHLLDRLADFCAALKEEQSIWQHALLLKRGSRQPVATSTDYAHTQNRHQM
jgi:NDP-sugar pyrophosphorylase family protein